MTDAYKAGRLVEVELGVITMSDLFSRRSLLGALFGGLAGLWNVSPYDSLKLKPRSVRDPLQRTATFRYLDGCIVHTKSDERFHNLLSPLEGKS